MSIISGALDRRRDVLNAMHLHENPFVKTEPDDHVIDRVFVGREPEMLDAAMRVVDRPRNILVQGGYGYGKTTFVRKLLRELRSAQKTRFLTGYAPLRHDSQEGLQVAALAALAIAIREVAPPQGPLHDYATNTSWELSRLDGESVAMRMPDLRFQEGLTLVQKAGFHRVVLAIDEIEKRDADVVLGILMGCRFFLDYDVSFVLTGRPMDVLGDTRSSLLGVFDHRIQLGLFTPEESAEILQRNLEVARKLPEAASPCDPFEQAVADTIVAKARGVPRLLNLMAYAALDEAIREAVVEQKEVRFVTPAHLDAALQREGNVVYHGVGSQGRELLARIFRGTGYVSGTDLDALVPGGQIEALRELEILSHSDAVLRMEAVDGAAFALSPQVSRSLEVLRAAREKLRALWSEAENAPDTHEKGKALERFAADFFGEAFVVAERNARTDTEEIDLVLEPAPHTDGRFRKGPYLLAECKNWQTQKVDQRTVSEFAGKLVSHNFTQGFLLTTGSFTDEALKQAVNIYLSGKVEIIPIDGAAVRGFLDDVRPTEDLLAELHRRLTLRQR